MKSTIYGSGANSTVTLYRIHQGGCHFKKDTSTEHAQIKALQAQLNGMGYNCGTADGKYGDKTVAGVKAFQKAYELTADGLFGKASLEALEGAMGGSHLDSNCQNSGDTGAYGCYDKVNGSLDDSSKYRVSSAMRIRLHSDALERIYAFAGEGTPLTVEAFMQKLEEYAADEDVSYAKKDCAHYIHAARNAQGATGATTEFGLWLKFFGSIKDLGGYDKLIPGMELFQGFRKTAAGNKFYASHIGVYAGKQTLQGSKVHAVYQSSEAYGSLKRKYNKDSGPNLTSMNDDWNYWGWSKFIRVR